jgi:hypothetical protein
MTDQHRRRPSTALVVPPRARQRPITAGVTAYRLAVAAIVIAALATAVSWSALEDVAALGAVVCLGIASLRGLWAARAGRPGA